MDKIRAELAELKSAIRKATSRIEALDELTAGTNKTDANTNLIDDENQNCDEPLQQAERLLKWSRKKAETLNFGSGLFNDSCWDMCLDIYICDLKGEKVTISSVAHSSSIPLTTAMRYINLMAEEGLLHKSPNPDDNRMIFVKTTDIGKHKITAVISNIRK